MARLCLVNRRLEETDEWMERTVKMCQRCYGNEAEQVADALLGEPCFAPQAEEPQGEAVAFLQALVKEPSLLGQEQSAQALMKARFQALGLDVRELVIDEAKLKDLHVDLVRLQQWVVHEGKKVCVVFSFVRLSLTVSERPGTKKEVWRARA